MASISTSDDYEIDDALRTLCRAKEIQADAKLMKKVQALAKKKMLEMGILASDSDD